MGKLFAGPWSDLRGRVGNTVGRYVDGQNIMAVRPHKSNKPASLLQQNHRDIFGIVTNIINDSAFPIQEGFRNSSKLKSRSTAVQYNLKNAVLGKGPNKEIDYPNFSFSRGKLAGALDMTMAYSVDGEETLMVSWTTDPKNVMANDTDFVNFMIYSPSTRESSGFTKVLFRSELKWGLHIPRVLRETQLEVYICFSSADGKQVSNSQYMGSILKP